MISEIYVKQDWNNVAALLKICAYLKSLVYFTSNRWLILKILGMVPTPCKVDSKLTFLSLHLFYIF